MATKMTTKRPLDDPPPGLDALLERVDELFRGFPDGELAREAQRRESRRAAESFLARFQAWLARCPAELAADVAATGTVAYRWSYQTAKVRYPEPWPDRLTYGDSGRLSDRVKEALAATPFQLVEDYRDPSDCGGAVEDPKLDDDRRVELLVCAKDVPEAVAAAVAGVIEAHRRATGYYEAKEAGAGLARAAREYLDDLGRVGDDLARAAAETLEKGAGFGSDGLGGSVPESPRLAVPIPGTEGVFRAHKFAVEMLEEDHPVLAHDRIDVRPNYDSETPGPMRLVVSKKKRDGGAPRRRVGAPPLPWPCELLEAVVRRVADTKTMARAACASRDLRDAVAGVLPARLAEVDARAQALWESVLCGAQLADDRGWGGNTFTSKTEAFWSCFSTDQTGRLAWRSGGEDDGGEDDDGGTDEAASDDDGGTASDDDSEGAEAEAASDEGAEDDSSASSNSYVNVDQRYTHLGRVAVTPSRGRSMLVTEIDGFKVTVEYDTRYEAEVVLYVARFERKWWRHIDSRWGRGEPLWPSDSEYGSSTAPVAPTPPAKPSAAVLAAASDSSLGAKWIDARLAVADYRKRLFTYARELEKFREASRGDGGIVTVFMDAQRRAMEAVASCRRCGAPIPDFSHRDLFHRRGTPHLFCIESCYDAFYPPDEDAASAAV